MSIYTTIDSPLGGILLAGTAKGALVRVAFDGAPQPGWRREPGVFAEVERQFREYFAGERTGFELEAADAGTDFQRRVWEAVAAVPYGTTTTYGELAATVGAPRDRIRAVGAAIGANPLLVVRPCHRVVGANGSLTGYAGGVERKQALLTLEGALQPQLAF
ncbi:methylated-DNA--[protein]-cysteine S-methyltransferase [Nonomuraea rhizosphaerae]|uniref:methylated-DNA--[protein]-cysteine S-methyltransferase n=1 Tax=Nonomuraea rhizosphaerae TaxID=2665663 RepID=UPI001C5CCC3E|nr:methylated-DNA--[protein]-cysteine S-methyltransferase [Nonomuraea rhizosphaerae]